MILLKNWRRGDNIVLVDRLAADGAVQKRGLPKVDCQAIGKLHFEQAVRRVHMRDGEEQGDIADLLFALLDEYWADFSSHL